jgi:hypothetical protein
MGYERRCVSLNQTPKGALHWRFRYRFAGKCKTLALGSHPVVTLDWARSRHKSFRDLLAHGIDPSALKTGRRICREEESYYRWKKIYGGMEPSEARELKQLREENIKLKRLVADLSLDKAMLQDVLQKKI